METVSRSVEVATPSDRAIVVTRSFDAPRRLVYAAWTEPELLKRWYGAHGWQVTDAAIDLQVGGSWRVVWDGPGGATMAASGVYREVSPYDRLVYTEAFDDPWYEGDSLVAHDFAEQAERTTLSSTYLFASQEIRDRVLATPMVRGISDGYERLDATLAELGSDPRWRG